MKRTRHTAVLLLVVPLLVAACGGGSTGPSAGSASPTAPAPTSASSTASATPSATASSTAVGYMPSAEVAKALLPATSMPGAKRSNTWTEDYPETSATSGYAETWLTFVSGNAACRNLLDGHPFRPGSSAGQSLDSSHLHAVQMISSLQSEADAKALMAQNVAQVKECKQFKARFDGRTYTFQHAGKVAKQTVGGGQQVTRRLTADLGSGQIVLWMLEARLGGEVMFLNLVPTDAKGASQLTMVAFLTAAKFADTVTSYRTAHPRAT